MKHTDDYWKSKVKEAGILNPVDRIAEVLFGLIMLLTFTGAISAGTDTREDVRQLLWAALGCNVAWGLVDAIMYLMNVAIERGHALSVIKQLHESKIPSETCQILKNEIQPGIAGLMTDQELTTLSERIKKIPIPSHRNLITGVDIWAGLQIFLLVFLCTLPVAIPFSIFDHLDIAMRVSNGVALLLLFIGGYLLAGYAGFKRLLTALAYTLIGVLLVSLTMALGG